MKIFIAAVSLICLSSTASANDSSAAVGIGGLELRQNNAISMDSEDLFISRQRITVKYRFTNTSTKDIETLVSFPLPPLPGGIEGSFGDQSIPNWRDDLHFKTFVDGKPVKLAIHEVVSVIGDPDSKEISAQLKSLGWPVSYWTDYPFEENLQKLPSDKKKQLLKQGLLRTEDGADYAIPNWQVTTHVTRTQRFPAGKTISVEHIYKPVAGGSVGGVLIAEYRKNSAEYFEEYAKRYCIDTAFLKAFDKAYARLLGAAVLCSKAW